MGWGVKSVIRLYGGMLHRTFEAETEKPRQTQQALLASLLRRNTDAVFGREHGFATIRNENEYRKRIAIQDYESLRPYIHKIMAGGRAVLTREPTLRFNLTSGTTGEPKYIPVTRESLQDSTRLMALWFYRALRDHPAMVDHSSVIITSPSVEGYTSGGIVYGSASGLAYEQLPRVLQSSCAIPRVVSQIKNYDYRYFVLARLALGRRVSFFATPNPSTLLRLAEIIAHNQDTLIRAVHDGKLGDISCAIEPEEQARITSSLEHTLKPDPGRAHFLSLVSENRDTLRLRNYWPDLQLVACWLGGSLGFHAQKLHELLGSTLALRDPGYQASEGTFTLPDKDHTPAGILAVGSNYYEFIPEKEADQKDPHTLTCDELEEGKRYAILLTTPGGLYRYHINDIVEVTGWYRNAPLLAFVRKGRDMANITGEKMHVNHLIAAMNTLGNECKIAIRQFRAIPNIEKSRYDVYMELSYNVPFDFVRDALISKLDTALATQNIEYRQKRMSKRLNPPCIYLMKEGWEQAIRREFLTSGRRDAQYKWRALLPEPETLDHEFIRHRVEAGPT